MTDAGPKRGLLAWGMIGALAGGVLAFAVGELLLEFNAIQCAGSSCAFAIVGLLPLGTVVGTAVGPTWVARRRS